MHIVYKTINSVNNKYYIGVHKTQEHNQFDGYLGSGKGLRRAIKKYGKNNFIRNTLFIFENVEDAYDKETELLATVYKNNDCYNMRPGGKGIRNVRIDNHSKAWRLNQSKAMTGRKFTKEHRNKIRLNQLGQNNTAKLPGVGAKISEAKRGVPNPHSKDIIWPKSKQIKTPLGTFNSMRLAGIAHNISGPTVKVWASKKLNGFRII